MTRRPWTEADDAHRPWTFTEARRAAACANLVEGRRKWEATRFRRPPKGTPEYRLYVKIRDTLGWRKAREELGL